MKRDSVTFTQQHEIERLLQRETLRCVWIRNTGKLKKYTLIMMIKGFVFRYAQINFVCENKQYAK